MNSSTTVWPQYSNTVSSIRDSFVRWHRHVKELALIVTIF